MNRLVLAASAIVVGMLVSGCAVGVRQWATDITATTATLNGRVASTEFGSVNYYVEYGPTEERAMRTPTKSTGASPGSSAQVSELLTGLEPGTTYHYAVCAEDAANQSEPYCSPDRIVVLADEDWVSSSGCWFCDFDYFNLDAGARPPSSNPWGRAEFGTRGTFISGPVTCLTVVGDKATVGVTGSEGRDGLLFVQDNAAGGTGRDYFGWRTLSTPPASCPAPTDADFPHVPPEFGDAIIAIGRGEIVVHDAGGTPNS